MATIALNSRERSVAIWRVLERAFAAVRHHPVVTLGQALLFGALPAAGFAVLMLSIDRSALVLTIASYRLPGVFALILLELFVSHVLGSIVQGGLVRPILAEEAGQRPGIGECLLATLRNLPSLFALGVLMGIGIEIGTTLLVVPAIFLYMLWAVAPAALAEEREGVFMALSRSQELVEGARLKILAMFLLIFVVMTIFSFAVTFLGRRLFSLDPNSPSLGYVGTLCIIGMVVYTTWAAVQASLYVELKEWKEGSSPEALAQVFV